MIVMVMAVVMMMVVMMMVVIVHGVVCAAFGLESCVDFLERGSETLQHFLNYVIWPNAEHVPANLGRQVAISKVPSKAHQLVVVFVTDFHQQLACCGDPKPGSVIELEPVAVGHGDRFWQIKQDVFSLVRGKADASSMTRVEIERERACRSFLRPMSGRAMNRSVMHRRLNT